MNGWRRKVAYVVIVWRLKMAYAVFELSTARPDVTQLFFLVFCANIDIAHFCKLEMFAPARTVKWF